MKRFALVTLFVFLLLSVTITFLGSCLITLSDGQGALIFIFSIPVFIAGLLGAFFIANRLKRESGSRIDLFPKAIGAFIMLFFVFSFVPFLKALPDSFMTMLGATFHQVTGKTPYVYVRERNSFSNHLARKLVSVKEGRIDFSEFGVSFAWDKFCIFGPYTNNAQAKNILKTDWNIEERSEIKSSDSINALVFLYQGKVNQVIDLKRGIADFKDSNVCIERNQSHFDAHVDPNGRTILTLIR